MRSTLNHFKQNARAIFSGLTAKILIFGGHGWIGKQFIELLESRSDVKFQLATSRPGTDQDSMVEEDIVMAAPSHIVCMIGRTHGTGTL